MCSMHEREEYTHRQEFNTHKLNLVFAELEAYGSPEKEWPANKRQNEIMQQHTTTTQQIRAIRKHEYTQYSSKIYRFTRSLPPLTIENRAE